MKKSLIALSVFCTLIFGFVAIAQPAVELPQGEEVTEEKAQKPTETTLEFPTTNDWDVAEGAKVNRTQICELFCHQEAAACQAACAGNNACIRVCGRELLACVRDCGDSLPPRP